MLTHYFELRAIPQLEITEVEVVNKLMQALHLELINHQGKIAIGFPRYTMQQRKYLGGIIRLFGEEDQLQQLKKALSQSHAITDYAIILDISLIPEKIKGYLMLSRVHQKGQSALRRAEKRLTQQGKWSPEVRSRMEQKWREQQRHYPHVHLYSRSTGQKFVLWISQRQFAQPQTGEFNCYGLSQNATVPDF